MTGNQTDRLISRSSMNCRYCIYYETYEEKVLLSVRGMGGGMDAKTEWARVHM